MSVKKAALKKPVSLPADSRGLLDFLFKAKGDDPVTTVPAAPGSQVLFHVKGRMSNFGGPEDLGMTPDEGLALFTPDDPDHPLHKPLFLAKAPAGTTGLGRRLNPDAHYIACRWDYQKTPRSLLRTAEVTVTNPVNGKSLRARPADWGPHEKTGRVADLSPGLEKALGLKTDQICEVVLAVGAPTATSEPAAGTAKPAPAATAPMPLATGAFQPPRIFSCKEWGAGPAKRTEFARNGAVGIVIHHTEGANRAALSGDKEKEAAFATARSIQKSHFNRNWSDTGQHFTVSQGGVIMEGRHGSLAAAANGECVQAAHAGDTEKNEQWFGIEICGDNRKAYHVTVEQWSAVVDLCAWLCNSRGGKDLEIIGHKEVHSTSCPGLLMEHLDDLRKAVSARRHPTSDVPEDKSFFSSFSDLFTSHANGLSKGTIRSLGLKSASALSTKSAAAELAHAHYVAAKFIWRYHLDPTVRDKFNPAAANWLARMLELRMEHTLLTPLPGTPADIAAARIKTSATTLVGICLHPKAENASLEPNVTKSQAITALAGVMSAPKKTVAQLGSVLNAAIRFA